MNTATDNRIFDLWPTTFLYYAPDGHEKRQSDLVTLALQNPEADILSGDDSAVLWLNAEINEAVGEYLKRYAGAVVENFKTLAHTVISEHSDYQPLINHPDAYLSGIYYVTVPTDIRENHHRNDVKSSAISFSDPRFAMNMGAIANDPYMDWHKVVRPKAGRLLIWPSFVDFFIHPNLSASKQISIHLKILVGGHQ